MALCTLRLRGPAGVSTIQLADTATLLELRAAILSSTEIPPEKQQIRAGVPPRPIDISKGDTSSLTDLGLRSGDVLIVQEGQANVNASASSPPPGGFHAPATSSSTAASTSGPPPSRPIAKPQSASQPQASSASVPSAFSQFGSSLQKNPNNPVHNNFPGGEGKEQKSGPPARNIRPQQPPLPAFSGLTSSGAKPGLTSTEDAHVKVDGGWMILRVVPDDNSCMFTSLAIALEHDKNGSPGKLRKVVADRIREDPSTWSEPVLGMPPTQYCDRILKHTTWGGAIELAIISEIYGVEIDSVDVQTGRADRFGEEKGFETQILLIYSGIHYDAVTFTPVEPDPTSSYPYSLDFDQTQFNKITDGYALPAVLELAQKLKAKHYYTDTAGFSLRCEICKKALKGEKEAQSHAKETGHASFGEY